MRLTPRLQASETKCLLYYTHFARKPTVFSAELIVGSNGIGLLGPRVSIYTELLNKA